jgi:hypothetical protein
MEVQTRYAKNDRGNTRGAIPAPTGATRRGILALRAVLWPQADRHQGGNPGQSGRGDRFLGSQPIGQGRSSRRKGGRPESAIGFISPQPCTRCAHTASMPVVSIARRPAREAVSARLLIRACVNQSEKRGPSARGCPGVARTRRSWDAAAEGDAIAHRTSDAGRVWRRDGGRTRARPLFFYAGSAAMGPEPTGPTRPSPGGNSGMHTPTQ